MSLSPEIPPRRTQFECVVPILRVASLSASVAYYLEVLGFELDWREPGVMASVSRDGRGVMLSEGCQGHRGTWVWIGVSDALALHAEYTRSGANPLHPPANYPWALESHVHDLDGHVLRFGSEPIADRPFDPWVE